MITYFVGRRAVDDDALFGGGRGMFEDEASIALEMSSRKALALEG